MSELTRVNGHWRNIKNQYVKQGGHWKKITSKWAKVNGLWKKTFSTDPNVIEGTLEVGAANLTSRTEIRGYRQSLTGGMTDKTTPYGKIYGFYAERHNVGMHPEYNTWLRIARDNGDASGLPQRVHIEVGGISAELQFDVVLKEFGKWYASYYALYDQFDLFNKYQIDHSNTRLPYIITFPH